MPIQSIYNKFSGSVFTETHKFIYTVHHDALQYIYTRT